MTLRNPRDRTVPNPLWSAVHVERQLAEELPQQFGCAKCGLNGDIQPLQTVYMVQGSTLCIEHLHEVANV